MTTSKDNDTFQPSKIVEEKVEATDNYEAVQFNAMKHGILSRHTVLPHEDSNEYLNLLSMLTLEHKPKGITETHLIEELAGIIWRKQRVLQAENSKINQGMKSASMNAGQVIPAALPFNPGLSGKDIDLKDLLKLTPDEVIEHQRYTSKDLEATLRAISILKKGETNAYKKALNTLQADSQEWWQTCVDEEEYKPTVEGLLEFIEWQLEPECKSINTVAKNHAAIKAQTIGEGIQVNRLVMLNRYETHLDRKFQRTLSMLVKLKELRND